VVGPEEGKILFMLDDLSGRTFGFMGLDYIGIGPMERQMQLLGGGGRSRDDEACLLCIVGMGARPVGFG
jgi:hypothetical protein